MGQGIHLFENLAPLLKGEGAREREETAESSAGRYNSSRSGLPAAAASNPDSLGHLCATCGYHLRGARGNQAHLHLRTYSAIWVRAYRITPLDVLHRTSRPVKTSLLARLLTLCCDDVRALDLFDTQSFRHVLAFSK